MDRANSIFYRVFLGMMAWLLFIVLLGIAHSQ
jgi:hypothetical protein